MRRAARIDANQPVMVKTLRALGFMVQHTHTVGGGAGDLVVAKHGLMVWVEVKDKHKRPSEQELTDDERKWHDEWAGYVIVATEWLDVVNWFEVRKDRWIKSTSHSTAK